MNKAKQLLDQARRECRVEAARQLYPIKQTVAGLGFKPLLEHIYAEHPDFAVEGHSDAASSKRLGVSPRTYASYIAALKEEYGVETRFQLGWAMSQTQQDRLDPLLDLPPEPTQF